MARISVERLKPPENVLILLYAAISHVQLDVFTGKYDSDKVVTGIYRNTIFYFYNLTLNRYEPIPEEKFTITHWAPIRLK